MTYYNIIKEALQSKKTASQRNYQVVYDCKKDQSKVYMFGHNVFKFDHKKGTVVYDFCGYEGYSKTTRCINYCLAAVNAPYKLKTKKRKVLEVSV